METVELTDNLKARIARMRFTMFMCIKAVKRSLKYHTENPGEDRICNQMFGVELEHMVSRHIPVPKARGQVKRPKWANDPQFDELWRMFEEGAITWVEFIKNWLDQMPIVTTEEVDWSKSSNWFY